MSHVSLLLQEIERGANYIRPTLPESVPASPNLPSCQQPTSNNLDSLISLLLNSMASLNHLLLLLTKLVGGANYIRPTLPESAPCQNLYPPAQIFPLARSLPVTIEVHSSACC